MMNLGRNFLFVLAVVIGCTNAEVTQTPERSASSKKGADAAKEDKAAKSSKSKSKNANDDEDSEDGVSTIKGKVTDSKKKTSDNTKEDTGNPSSQKDTQSQATDNKTGQTGGNSNIVEFRIKAGTNGNAYNTRETMVKLKVGQTLRVHNDDSTAHWIHSPGVPFDHPSGQIEPGSFEDYEITAPCDPGELTPLHDHIFDGESYFWIKAE